MSTLLTPSAFFLSPRAAKSARVVEEDASQEASEAQAAEEFGCDEEGDAAMVHDEDYDVNQEPDDEEMGDVDYVLHPNQMVVTLSYTLLNQVRQVARAEGVAPEDFILELVAEGITRRAFEDAQRPQPSHLMTRTGYVPPDADGYRPPQLTHHYNGQNGNQNGGNGNYRGGNQNNQQRRFNGNKPFNGPSGSQGGSQGGGGQSGNRFNRNNNNTTNGNTNGNQKSRFDPRGRNNKNGNG